MSEKELREYDRLKTMIQYIQENLAEELTVEQIAESALLSKSECLRCFRNALRITPMRYVKQRRIEAASALLLNTQQKIADIGFACGFGDTSYFVKAFHDAKGMTPRAWRTEKSGIISSSDRR